MPGRPKTEESKVDSSADEPAVEPTNEREIPCPLKEAPSEETPPPPPPPPCAYRMTGGAAKLVVDAVVCDISQPFTVTGTRIKIDFVPSAADPLSGGTYTYFGDFGKFSVSGQGTYRVKLTPGGGSITGKGTGIAKSPRGTFSAFGKEHYRLTPTTCS